MNHTSRVARIKALAQGKLLETLASPTSRPQHWKPAGLIRRVIQDRRVQTLLTLKTSLTAKLKTLCPSLQVVVLSEEFEAPLASEAMRLGLNPKNEAWVRCVLLKCESQNWIYARTIIPHLDNHNPWQELQKLGNKPLGEILFEMPSIQRTEFEFSKDKLAIWPHLMEHLPAGNDLQEGFARRSVFSQDQAPLLLTEVYLPELQKTLFP